MSKIPRILFYVERSLHLPYLRPIQTYLDRNGLAETAYSAPPYFPGDDILPGWGLTADIIRELQTISRFYPQPTDFDPDVTIVADACHSIIPELRQVINVGHGMICKGAFYTKHPGVRRENLSELILVPGPWHKERLEENVVIPIVTTGFIKGDQLFGPQAMGRKRFCRQNSIDPEKKIVLFAPTYNPELSSIPCVQERIAEIADENTVLLIKLHNLTDESWKDMYAGLAERYKNIHYLSDADYSGMMHAADLILSDVSSIFIEFILMDKPAVLVQNPRIEEFASYRPDDIEYLTRDCATVVDSADELLKAVPRELENPGRLAGVRQKYAGLLDNKRDGQSAERAGRAILDWYRGEIKYEPPKTAIVLIPEENTDPKSLRSDLDELKNKLGDVDYEVLIWNEPLDLATEGTPGTEWFSEFGELKEKINPACEFILFVRGGQKYPRNSLKWLHSHFLWNPKTGAVKAVTQRENADAILEKMEFDPSRFNNPAIVSWALLVTGMGQSVSGRPFFSSCVLCSGHILEKLLEKPHPPVKSNIFPVLDMTVLRSGYNILLAADCYVWEKQDQASDGEKCGQTEGGGLGAHGPI